MNQRRKDGGSKKKAVNVKITHHIDASEKDAQGMYEYYYEYDIYHFTDGDKGCVARSYSDEPEEAHFLNVSKGKRERPLRKTDLQTPLLLDAIEYLRAAGKRKLKWLSEERGDYIVIPRSGPDPLD